MGRQFDGRDVRGYFIDFSAKTLTPGAGKPEGLRPAAKAQLALGWWERSLLGDGGAGDRFLPICVLLLETAEKGAASLRWSYDVPVPKFGLEAPWYSALAQGQIASVFVRAHLQTGDDRWAEAARLALAPLIDDESDLVGVTDAGPVLEETSQCHAHILNGWVFATWGLWDVRIGLRDETVEPRLTATVECLRRLLPRFDLGWWTRYSLLDGAGPDVAQPFYHRLHVDQAEIMHRLTGFGAFGEAAGRWRAYDTPLGRTRAIANKAFFAAAQAARR
jgi:hypothetical protein